MDPLHGPATRNPAWSRTNILYVYGSSTYSNVRITASTLSLRQDPAHCCIIYLTLVPSSESTVTF